MILAAEGVDRHLTILPEVILRHRLGGKNKIFGNPECKIIDVFI